MTVTRNFITHHYCRLCGSKKLMSVFNIGDQFINDFVEPDRVGCGNIAPIDIVFCNNCSLVQLRDTAPQELLYSRNYWYRSGVTNTMNAQLKNVYQDIIKHVELLPGDVFLDIGANDGTLLKFVDAKDVIKVGCEPANNLIEPLKKHCDVVIHDFWSLDAYTKKVGHKKAKAVSAIGMFYDLDDPMSFVKDIKSVLDDDGIFIAQLMTLDPMIKKNDLGNLCHEHIEHYSYQSLKYLFEKSGLEIYEVTENDVNGGSYRIFARHYQSGSIHYKENASSQDLLIFKNRIDAIKDETLQFIKSETSKGKTIHAYGASTKGNVILQYFGLNSQIIPFASERSPQKWGKYTVGTWIPIISEDESRKMNPDYYFVLPWAFFDEMYERESVWRKQGGKFIVPFPELKVVG